VSQPVSAARLRGVAAGLLTAALAVAAHGTAGHAVPSGTAVALLAVLAATVGGLTATMSRASDPRVLLAVLVAGQLVGHIVLTFAGHSHGTAPGAAMLTAHALAVVAGAALISTGDRLCRRVSRVLEVTVRAVVPPIPAKPYVIVACADHPARSTLLLAASVSHRGPPVSPAR
jgi:small basic protein